MSIQTRAPPRRSPWQRASSDTSCPCGPHGWKTAKASTPSTASCRLRPSPEGSSRRTQPRLLNHFKHRISSTEFDRQVNQLAVVADRHHNPKIPAFSGYTEASSDGPVESAASPGMRRYAGRRKPGEDRSGAAVFKSPLVPESVLRGEPSHRYPWRSFKAVCPRRCWRQPGPPIPAPNRARDGHSEPSSEFWCAPATCRSSAGSRPAPGHVRRSCVGGRGAGRLQGRRGPARDTSGKRCATAACLVCGPRSPRDCRQRAASLPEPSPPPATTEPRADRSCCRLRKAIPSPDCQIVSNLL